MQNRLPGPPNGGAPLPDFTPVPRKCARHDGWTPERQKAFIEALADTGCVSRAAAMVNMSQVGAYYLRRQPGAESFRRAWEDALDFGLARLKDIAFERAIEGYLVPMFAGGKLLGYRRKHNDRLLMFCLRHYGEDSNGKRTTINYFSTRASAGAAAVSSPERGAREHDVLGTRQRNARPPKAVEGALSQAEASTTTVRTTISGQQKDPLVLMAGFQHCLGDSANPPLSKGADALNAFEGVELDARASEEIATILAACAARQRELAGTSDDPAEPFIPAEGAEHLLEFETRFTAQPGEQYRSSDAEMPWAMLDDEEGMAAIEEAVASVKASKLRSS